MLAGQTVQFYQIQRKAVVLKVVPFFNKLAGWRDAILLEKEAAAFDVFL